MNVAPICLECKKSAEIYNNSDLTVETVWLCPQGDGVVKKQTQPCPKCGGPTKMDDYDIFHSERFCKCTHCNHVLTTITVRHSERAKYIVKSLQNEGKTSEQKPVVDKANIPCKHGDECWTDNCPYFHSFTKKKTPCKFGDGCRTDNCPYAHPLTKKKTPCKYGTGCRTASCPYNHGY